MTNLIYDSILKQIKGVISPLIYDQYSVYLSDKNEVFNLFFGHIIFDIDDISTEFKVVNSNQHSITFTRNDYFKFIIHFDVTEDLESLLIESKIEYYELDLCLTTDIRSISDMFFSDTYTHGNNVFYEGINSQLNYDSDYLYRLFECLKCINLRNVDINYRLHSNRLNITFKSLNSNKNVLSLSFNDKECGIRLDSNGASFNSHITKLDDFYMNVPIIEMFIKNHK